MPPTYILVSGSQGITDPAVVFPLLAPLKQPGVIALFGDADGVDTLVHQFCHMNRIHHLPPFKPEYKKYKKYAPLVRNTEMVNICCVGICIGVTPGTTDTARKLERAGKLSAWYKIPAPVS